MALIECTDCGHDVSKVAPTCPNCGRPIKKQKPQKTEAAEQPSKRLPDEYNPLVGPDI